MMEVKNKDLIPVIGNMEIMGHEQVVFCYDSETGLKAIIAIHDTTLGPALGGTRMWNYTNETDALNDVLRLSRGMTFKASISGLNLGGGKAVIIGDASTEKTEALMKKFGEYVNKLGGTYITAEDVGMSTKDMEYVREMTKHVTGIPESMGGSGDPSPVTAYGVYWGMKASAKFKRGSDSLEGKTILVQGVGHVGENLVKHITEERAKVFITDINEEKLQELKKEVSNLQTYKLDATNKNEVENFCSSIDLVDVLFHAVGFVHHGTLMDCDNDEFKRSIAVSYTHLTLPTNREV